jgi:hypothetical protein
MKMLKKKILLFIVISILMPVSVFGENITSKNPALKLMSYYIDEIEDKQTINPYTVNIIAIYEISHDRHISEIKNYILWYFAHLNHSDKDKLSGSIYDYEISETGREISTEDYDSADGYAGTFLYLLNLYYLKTGDKALINAKWDKIKDIAYLITFLQTEDGLTKALAQGNSNARYLMDNCEAYAGLKAFNELSAQTGHGKDNLYLEAQNEIYGAMHEILYDSNAGNFYWAVDDERKHPSDWSIFYPDALAQLFPIYYDILNLQQKKKKELFQEFSKRYGAKMQKMPLEQRMIYELTSKRMID